jgi:capsular polysaccharide biosynthesis protein
LVVPSQAVSAQGHDWAAADPETVDIKEGVKVLPGTWLYGGHWFNHFGHFVLETLTTLWPQDLEVEGILFHRWVGLQFWVKPYQERLIELAGYGHVPLRSVGKRPLRVERLYVPSRTVALEGWAHPQAHDVWQRVAKPFRNRGGPRKVYVSRTELNAVKRAGSGNRVRSSPERDLALDETFHDAGFAVIRPETMPIDDQLRAYADAEVVAGLASSALHLAAACAPPGGRVLELCDSRFPTRITPNQRSINFVSGHRQARIEDGVSVEAIPKELASLGLC